MLVFNLKLNKKRITIIAVAAVAVITVILFSLMVMSNKSLPDSATCDEIGKYSLVAQTTGGEIGFLSGFGYEADKNSRTVKEVIIPTQFNNTYSEYNKLQQRIGLNLEYCKGKKAKMITYELKASKIKYAVILVCDGKVVAGHLTNGEYGGKYRPLI